jgi:hypothetical protein
MYEIEEITTERLPEQLDAEHGRKARLAEIARLADDLSRTAAGIPSVLPTIELPPEDTRRFRDLTEQLIRDAFALRDRAILGEIGSARDETEQLLATCNACHAICRITPSAAASTRAP